jgi:hypothetical protein
MSTVTEYLRTTLSFDDEGISNFVVFGMRPLRAKSDQLKVILENAKEEALKMFQKGLDEERINQSINYVINQAVAEMVQKGDAFIGEQLRGADVTGYLQLLDYFSYVYSNDGYSFFNPAQFHPGASLTKH